MEGARARTRLFDGYQEVFTPMAAAPGSLPCVAGAGLVTSPNVNSWLNGRP